MIVFSTGGLLSEPTIVVIGRSPLDPYSSHRYCLAQGVGTNWFPNGRSVRSMEAAAQPCDEPHQPVATSRSGLGPVHSLGGLIRHRSQTERNATAVQNVFHG